MTYAGHVLRGSSGISAVLMLEGKTNSVRTRGRPRKNWIDDLKEWNNVTDYSELKGSAEDMKHWKDLAYLHCT